jgi:hypothetical protein
VLQLIGLLGSSGLFGLSSLSSSLNEPKRPDGLEKQDEPKMGYLSCFSNLTYLTAATPENAFGFH